MLSKEDFEVLSNNLRSKLDDTSSALVSEESLAILSAYNNGYDEMEKVRTENEKLKQEKEELLKVNGRLYQKIGFDKSEDPEPKPKINEEYDTPELKIEDVINEKGDLI